MEWPITMRFYYGTRAEFTPGDIIEPGPPQDADLGPGDLIEPGHSANFGGIPREANYVYVTRTLDAATWGAELSAGEGPGRIYIVEPTGPVEDDPNLTDQRFRGNPTKSFRSREPVQVVGEVVDWQGHSPATQRTRH
jgi:hypothetical protein